MRLHPLADGKCAGGWGGTSFAAPRWAGYLALLNQQASGKGHGTLGFINPAICGIGLGSSYAAEKGYDLVTGWGSPNGVTLSNALAP